MKGWRWLMSVAGSDRRAAGREDSRRRRTRDLEARARERIYGERRSAAVLGFSPVRPPIGPAPAPPVIAGGSGDGEQRAD